MTAMSYRYGIERAAALFSGDCKWHLMLEELVPDEDDRSERCTT